MEKLNTWPLNRATIDTINTIIEALTPPDDNGTYVLKSVDGVLTWVEE